MPHRNPGLRKSAAPRSGAGRQAGLPSAGIPTVSPVLEFVRILGIPAPDTPTLIRRVQEGFPYAALERLQHAFGLSTDEVATLVQIPPRTLTRRRGSGRLKADESDRVLRAARLMHQAAALFNHDLAVAKAWMTTPQRGLGGVVPLDLARTELGAREVEDALGRIEDGIFA